MRMTALAAAAALLLLSACSSQLTDARLKERVREVMREDPSLVMEALEADKVAVLELVEQGAKERRLDSMRAQWRKDALTPLDPAVDETRPMLGAPDAAVTVVAYTDFQCGYCARGAATLAGMIADGAAIRYFAKHAPMSGTGEYAARVFEAVALQDPDAAWSFYKRAFAEQGALGGAEDAEAAYLALASGLPGVDAERLAADVESEAVRSRVKDDAAEFMQWGFRGVPVYLFNGVPVEGALPRPMLEELKDIVAPDRDEAAATSVDDGDAYSAAEAGLCEDCLE